MCLCFYCVYKTCIEIIVFGCSGCECVHALNQAPGWSPLSVRRLSVHEGLFGRNDTGQLCKSVSDRGSDGVSAFLPLPSPPTVQSIQLLSPQGSRQSIKASGCILLTCAAPLMNSQHDPGWQAGNGCNKDCFCMLFASLINHLAVQQIREPHGNLISHGKGEEEENSEGKGAESGRATLFYFPPFFFFFYLADRWSKMCGGWMGGHVFVCTLTYPTNALLSLAHASVPVSVKSNGQCGTFTEVCHHTWTEH